MSTDSDTRPKPGRSRRSMRSYIPPRKYAPPLVPLVLWALTGLALIASVAGTTWFAIAGKLDVSFSELKTATSLPSAPGVQHLYFDWLGVTLVVVVLVVLLLGVLVPVLSVAQACRIVVLAGSVAGIVLTLVAIKQLDNQDPGGSFVDHLKWSRLGVYLHVIGWILAIVAATATERARNSKGSN